MESNKVSIEKAMEMSLDDYIKESKIYVSPMLKQPRIYDNRNKNKDMDLKMEEDDDDELTSNDLRGKISEGRFKTENELPKCNSVQYRLMAPNNIQSRPAGMPPLVPNCLPNAHNNNWYNNVKKWKHKNNFDNSYNNNRFNNNNTNRFNNNRNRFNNNCNQDFRGVGNNGRIQPKKYQNNMQNFDLRIQIAPDDGYAMNQSTLSKPLSQQFIISQAALEQKPQQQQCTALIPTSTAAQFSLSSGINLATMAQMAKSLLAAMEGPKEPKYDMGVQKVIHNIQQKPFMVNCSTNPVITSDGPGIANCKLTPSTTNLTCNMRFSTGP